MKIAKLLLVMLFSIAVAACGGGGTPSSTPVTTNPPATASKLNDTGITASQCYQAGNDVLVACNSAGATALNNAQDGMVGRDANAATNGNTDGKLGFSFAAVTGGCVQDNVTGLMWEVKTTDGGLRDWRNAYTNYSATYNPNLLYGAATDASGFVPAVNAINLCGYGDWRLPTADELQSIVDYGVTTPAIDPIWFPSTPGLDTSPYWTTDFWTATPSVGAPSDAWNVNFGGGSVANNPMFSKRNQSKYVRLVRAGQPPITSRYTVSADGLEVTDNQTNLIWQRCADGMVFSGSTCTGTASTFTHEAALQRAAALASSTGIVWRLPDVKELSSITDKNSSNSVIDSTAFPATPPSSFWTATPVVNNSSSVWFVTFSNGGAYNGGGVRGGSTGYVRLVRAGHLSSVDTPPAAALYVAGTWIGAASDSTGPGTLTLNLAQTGSIVSGNGSACATGGSCASITSVNASVSGATAISGVINATYSTCAVALNFTAGVFGTTLSGTYTGTNSCTGPFSGGAMYLQKQ